MRTSQAIEAEMNELRLKDKAYNRLVNEGGEGYETENARIPELFREWKAAMAAEFAAEWTVETLAARRAAWNVEIRPLVEAGKPVKPADVQAIERRLGYTMSDIKRAKALHGES